MLHQFAHGGDLHLGPHPRNADRIRAFDQFGRETLALPHLAATLLLGDSNHGPARLTIEDRNYLATHVLALAARAPVIWIQGNHDLDQDMQTFAKLAGAHPIYVIDQPTTLRFKTATRATVTAFCLPYPHEGQLVAAGVSPGAIVATAHPLLEGIVRDAAVRLADARAQGDLTMVLGHLNIAGSLNSGPGQPNIGQEIELDPALLSLFGDCYKGFNHIHKGQEIGGAWYAGSFCRLDWGEIEPKRWLLVEYDAIPQLGDDEYGALAVTPVRWSYRVTPQPIDVAPLYHVEGVLSRERFDWIVKAGPEGEPLSPPTAPHATCNGVGCGYCAGSGQVTSWVGCEVRVRYRYNASEKAILELARAQILAIFAEAKRLELEPIAVPDRGVRAPAVAAAKTLAEKVEAWADLNKGTVTDGAREKLAALQGRDPAALLQSVQATMAALTAAPEDAVELPQEVILDRVTITGADDSIAATAERA